ncbi:MAG: hypothetical protein UT34_C0001G0293 [candidate division WS6 bacterium GW2011_GWF2_39_15]|uniref:FCP1 homology domain-containing protein n=1 Tax=candidate division WS6 bacterium GW2011_GWF2_39_15 TaxID=1619100 RepID=A0A0G0MSX9_9BACT|nr:MAG: hypothetical protein UT34_C0001G0293 [candidate division WS6 bacterium GW2011_GWF2_39_15]
MNIYLDIDGVILTKQGDQMPYLQEFLSTIFDLFPTKVYWLTTHCKDGTTNWLFKHIDGKLDPINEKFIMRVKPTKWDTLKTEAIDFTKDFLWFDDNVLMVEQKILQYYKKFDSWVKVEDNLEEITGKLKNTYR